MPMDSNINIILKKYPFLKYDKEERAFLGYIYLNDYDAYHLKIDISTFPEKFPKVFELAERIPQKADRHINSDNSLCFTTNVNEEILLKTKIVNLDTFFELILLPYLVNNSYFEEKRTYMFGEYNHHPVVAIFETYKDLLGIEDLEQIAKVLKQIANGIKFRPNDICYCGSGRKIKKCSNHEKCYRNIKILNNEQLNEHSSLFLGIIKLLSERYNNTPLKNMLDVMKLYPMNPMLNQKTS